MHEVKPAILQHGKHDFQPELLQGGKGGVETRMIFFIALPELIQSDLTPAGHSSARFKPTDAINDVES